MLCDHDGIGSSSTGNAVDSIYNISLPLCAGAVSRELHSLKGAEQVEGGHGGVPPRPLLAVMASHAVPWSEE